MAACKRRAAGCALRRQSRGARAPRVRIRVRVRVRVRTRVRVRVRLGSWVAHLEEAEEVAALVYLGEACGIEEDRVVLAQRVLLPLEPREHLLLVDALDVGAAVAALRLVRRLGEVLRLRAGG